MRSRSKSQSASKSFARKAKALTSDANSNDNKRGKLLFDNLLARKLDDSRQNESCRRLSSATENIAKVVLFENVAELMKPELVAAILGISVKTIYDWRYRFKQRKIPEGLFVKINRSLLIRTKVLRHWIASQNPSLFGEGE